jgi:hypothetical protein
MTAFSGGGGVAAANDDSSSFLQHEEKGGEVRCCSKGVDSGLGMGLTEH